MQLMIVSCLRGLDFVQMGNMLRDGLSDREGRPLFLNYLQLTS